MGGVEDDAGDIDEAGVVESVQHGLVKPAPQTGSLDQIRNLRYAVDFDMPKQGGRTRQAQPLTRTTRT
jgi:hypothetical protein